MTYSGVVEHEKVMSPSFGVFGKVFGPSRSVYAALEFLHPQSISRRLLGG